VKKIHPEEQEKLNAIKVAFDEYYSTGQKMAHSYIQGGPELGNKMMLEFDTTSMEINDKVDLFQQENIKDIENSLAHVEKLIDNNKQWFLWMFCIILLICVVVGLLFVRSIIVPVNMLTYAAKVIAKGDLCQKDIEVKTKDEIKDLADSFNSMKSNLHSLIHSMTANVEHTTSAAEELAASTVEISNHV